MLEQQLAQQCSDVDRDHEATGGEEGPAPDPTTGDADGDLGDTHPEIGRGEAVDAAAWAILNAKECPGPVAFSTDDIAHLLDASHPATLSLPSSLLAVAPHLKDLSETWKLQHALTAERMLDTLISLLQLQHLPDPIPQSIWKDITKDAFIDFEKLHASMDQGYNHDDKAKEFVGGFSLVKKDQVSAKKPIRTESEWIHVFSAWSTGVILVYFHCADELEGYRQFVLDLFCTAPSQPQLVISFKVEVQDKYAKSPFHLDDHPHSGVGVKRAAPSLPQPVKWSMVICQNWNLGWCEDPCKNRCKHGYYSECSGQHRAKDKATCLILLQANSSQEGSSGTDWA
ncbi:hypothetical protein CPB84DRAFT_1816247 [Gymnopilus junonius]|uniref:Uncharacterized protein n=1 Tax=Gymnopilus junonius TaxID=109634 RepID=A0A9P5NKZ2_GYMJU|nr:hypothetical protein CPB84DRAFT_1816247 [Gymnopilus junonius]